LRRMMWFVRWIIESQIFIMFSNNWIHGNAH
jgi:hypothetical protein